MGSYFKVGEKSTIPLPLDEHETEENKLLEPRGELLIYVKIRKKRKMKQILNMMKNLKNLLRKQQLHAMSRVHDQLPSKPPPSAADISQGRNAAPVQPKLAAHPKRLFKQKNRSFNPAWYKAYPWSAIFYK